MNTTLKGTEYVTFMSVFSNISDHKFIQFKYDK